MGHEDLSSSLHCALQVLAVGSSAAPIPHSGADDGVGC